MNLCLLLLFVTLYKCVSKPTKNGTNVIQNESSSEYINNTVVLENENTKNGSEFVANSALNLDQFSNNEQYYNVTEAVNSAKPYIEHEKTGAENSTTYSEESNNQTRSANCIGNTEDVQEIAEKNEKAITEQDIQTKTESGTEEDKQAGLQNEIKQMNEELERIFTEYDKDPLHLKNYMVLVVPRRSNLNSDCLEDEIKLSDGSCRTKLRVDKGWDASHASN